MCRSRASRCVLVACFSAAAILAWQEFVIRFHYQGLQTGLFYTGSSFPAPPPLRAGTFVFENSTGYDAQFYRYVSHDPFVRRGFDRYMDNPRHRYGRILVPLIAWAASGGQDRWIDTAYRLTVVAFCALGVYWTCCWLVLSACPAVWGAAAFLLLPATLASVDRMLLDGPLCAVFAGYLFYTRVRRRKAVYAIAAMAPLIRETGILIVAAVIAAAVLERRWRHLVVFTTAAIPALCWWLYVVAHTAPSDAVNIAQKPVIGLLVRLFTPSHNNAAMSPSLYVFSQTVEFLAIAGYILCLFIAARWLWIRRTEWRDPVNSTIAGFLILGLMLGDPVHLQVAYGYARPLSPLILWLVLLALESRKWAALIPPALVSAAVGAYVAVSTLRAFRTLVGG